MEWVGIERKERMENGREELELFPTRLKEVVG